MAQQILQSVENSLTILEIMAATEAELGVTDISKKLAISTSSAHRLLITLVAKDFVVQNPITGKYRLGTKIVTLGNNVLINTNVIIESHPYLQELSQQVGMTALLSLYSKGEVTCVDKILGSNPIELSDLIGLQRPAHCTASGKALLAFLPPKELDKYIREVDLLPLTPYTLTDKDELLLCLAEIRAAGFAEDQQEAQEGFAAFAAPVRNGYGDAAAAMVVTGPASRLNSRKEELVDCLLRMSERASLACGWRPPATTRASRR